MKTDLIMNTNPKSMFSESIKNIRTNLAFASIDKPMKKILTTSPEQGDGKSFISANLAVAYAQDNKKVLIIDCDLRRGRQHEIFGVMNEASGGYSNLILNYDEKVKFDKYILHTSVSNVDLLPSGPVPPNPVELLASKHNKELLDKISEEYDIVILDCPPILGISDTSIMTQYSDANLMVVSSNKTHLDLIDKAKKVFETANSKISGVIVNKANIKGSSYYNYYYNDYYGEKE